jgi:2-iminobutanoate/2-iminopropanoate deaminase
MKRVIEADRAPLAVGPYSQAVESHGVLFISGQVPLVPETRKLIAGGIREQTEQVMKNIGAILEAAGYGYGHVVKSTCLLTSMDDFSEMNEIYSRYYPDNQPARVAYAVCELPLGALVEIETIAMQ